jgi:hypothetical protein
MIAKMHLKALPTYLQSAKLQQKFIVKSKKL